MPRELVIQGHSPPDYPAVSWKRGQKLKVGRRDTEWTEFLWCQDDFGQSGWAPEPFLEMDGMTAVLKRDYETTELTVSPGDFVDVVESVAEWHWCRNSAGDLGWIPARCLVYSDASSTL
jgi:hypothetical protein